MNADIKAIKERCDKATPGPWEWNDDDILCAPAPYYLAMKPFYDDDTGEITICSFQDDRDFIAHAREDIPALLEEVESLQAQLTESQKNLDTLVKNFHKDCSKCNSLIDLREQLAKSRERERAAVEDLKISAYCRTCAKKCGLSESLSKRMHEGGCRDYEWRGPAGEGAIE